MRDTSKTENKPERFTVAEIASRNAAAGRHYFDRDTLRFFNQKRGDFRVYHVGGRVFVYGKGRPWTLGTGSVHVWSIAEFDTTDSDLRSFDKTTHGDLLPDSLMQNHATTAEDIRRALAELVTGKGN